MASKKSVSVRILDQNFMINTDAPQEEVQKIADFLTANMEQIKSKSKNASPYNIAILAALNITEKYFSALEQQNEFKTSVADKSRKILGLLDSSSDVS